MKYTEKENELILRMMDNSTNKSLTSKALAEELNRSARAIAVHYYTVLREKPKPVTPKTKRSKKSNIVMFLWNKFTYWLTKY